MLRMMPCNTESIVDALRSNIVRYRIILSGCKAEVTALFLNGDTNGYDKSGEDKRESSGLAG
jgi:hypothetical protein